MNKFSIVMMVAGIMFLVALVKVIDIEVNDIHVDMKEWEREI